MRSPGLSLRSFGALVLIAAGDFAMTLAVIHAADLGSNVHGELAPEVFVLGVPLMGGLLVAVLTIMPWGLWRRGECHAFLVGFESFGWGALLLYLAGFVWTDGWSDLVPRYINSVLSPFAPVLRNYAQTDPIPATAISAAIVSLPMLSVALIGGMLSSRFGITIVVQSQRGAGRRPQGTNSSATSASPEV